MPSDPIPQPHLETERITNGTLNAILLTESHGPPEPPMPWKIFVQAFDEPEGVRFQLSGSRWMTARELRKFCVAGMVLSEHYK